MSEEASKPEEKEEEKKKDVEDEAKLKALLSNLSTLKVQDLVQNIHVAQCKDEYVSRISVTSEEFVIRAYKLVALRASLQQQQNKDHHRYGYSHHDRDGEGHSSPHHGTSNLITALIQSNLLSADKADRYLEKQTSRDCKLTTSLPSDVFGFVQQQLNPIRDGKLKADTETNAEFMVQIITKVFFPALYGGQKSYRDELLKDQEQCCAGSNDFDAMATKVQRLVQDTTTHYTTLPYSSRELLNKEADHLINLYQADADYAAQKVSYFIFRDGIKDANFDNNNSGGSGMNGSNNQHNNSNKKGMITIPLFSKEWLQPPPPPSSSSEAAEEQDNNNNNDGDDDKNTTESEKSKKTTSSSSSIDQLTTTLQKYVTHLQEDLGSTMFPKALQALVTRFVNYYLERLLRTSTAHKSTQEPYFGYDAPTTAANGDNNDGDGNVDEQKRNVISALVRIRADIDTALGFFRDLVVQPDHSPLIDAEMDLLVTIHNILVIAAGLADSTELSPDGDDDFAPLLPTIQECVLSLQARIEKYDTTYYVMGDLYHLVNAPEEKKAYEITKSMARELRSFNRSDYAEEILYNDVPGLSLRTMLVNHLVQSRGQRTRLGAGMLNNFFGRIGGAWVSQSPATGSGGAGDHHHEKSNAGGMSRSASADPLVAGPSYSPQPEKLTYEELEKELFDMRQELEEVNDKAKQAEFEANDLRRQLAKANKRAERAEAKIKEMEKQRQEESSSSPQKRPSVEVDV